MLWIYGMKRPGPGRIRWARVMGQTFGEAIRAMRTQLGYGPQPYAGPIPERCAHHGCGQHAAVLRNNWLPQCAAHSQGPFPGHWEYS